MESNHIAIFKQDKEYGLLHVHKGYCVDSIETDVLSDGNDHFIEVVMDTEKICCWVDETPMVCSIHNIFDDTWSKKRYIGITGASSETECQCFIKDIQIFSN